MWSDGRFVVAWEGLKQGKDDGWGVYCASSIPMERRRQVSFASTSR